MTQIDIISGFLGAGKTTLIKKLIKEACAGEKLPAGPRAAFDPGLPLRKMVAPRFQKRYTIG